jgi:fatty acid synthase
MYRNINILKAGGVELRGMKASLAPRRQQAQASPKLEQYTFIPYDNTTQSKVGLCHIFLYFVDHASLYNLVNKANLVHSFS